MKKITGVICYLIAIFAAAEEPNASESSSPPAEKKSWFEKYYPYERKVYGWVENTGRSVDSFFGTDDAWRVDNESWLRVTNDVRWEQDEGMKTEIRPRLKIDLPTASERLHLLIENDSPEQRSAAQEAVPALRNTDNERTTVFGLGADLNSWLPAWKKQLQAGVQVRLPLDPYVRFIAKRNWQLQGPWEVNSYNRLAWFEHQGYSWKSELKIGEPLAPRWRLDYVTDLSWREDRDYLQFAESANFTHILSEKSAVSYIAGVEGTGFSGPQINSYFLVADYRRDLFRRLVFFDVIPELSFPREYGFDAHWAITLRLELYFQKEVDGYSRPMKMANPR